MPLEKRKAIFWIIMIVISSLLFYFWIMDVQKRISTFHKEPQGFLENSFTNPSSSSKKEIEKVIEEQEKINENLEKLFNTSSSPSSSEMSSTTSPTTSSATSSTTSEDGFSE